MDYCRAALRTAGWRRVKAGIIRLLPTPGLLKRLDFLRHGPGHCYVKLTAPYRMASAPAYADVTLIAQTLIDVAPERIIWGSDHPFLSHADKVNAIVLFNRVAQWLPDAAMRQRILVDNPARFFGFTK